jgi:hypothetical protein
LSSSVSSLQEGLILDQHGGRRTPHRPDPIEQVLSAIPDRAY